MQVLTESFEVVVCGGGLAGFSAALAAARHGAQTVLIQDRPVLGGNSSSEIRVTPHGAAAFHGYARESGIVAEALIRERAINHEPITENGWTNSVWDLVLYDMAIRTDNLTLHLNATVEDVELDGVGGISSLRARIANAETLLDIHGTVFVDCTGDGTLAALAGCEWMSGSESHAEFGEPHAPLTATPGVMGSSLHFKTVDIGRPAPYTPPKWAVKYNDPEFFYQAGRVPKTVSSGYWWIEIGPPWDTLHDNEAIRHELTRHILGIWDFFKNRDPYWKQQAENLALDWVGQVPGKRESRRLCGEILVNENDLIDQTVYPDEIAYGGWYVDLHTLGGLLAPTSEPLNARKLDPTSSYGASTNVGPFGIPLRALISKDIRNLLFAGRNISATHAALGSMRVMSTGALMGQAAGTAAALSLPGGRPRDLVENCVGALQQALLRDGCFLPNYRNEDPDDLALTAAITATSEEQVRGVGPQSADWLGGLDQWRDHPVFPFRGILERRTAQWIATGAAQQLDTVELCLKNLSEEPQLVSASLYRVDNIWSYETDPGVPLREAELRVPPGGPHWVKFHTGLSAPELPTCGYVRIDLSTNHEVEWLLASTVQPGHLAAYEASPGRYRRFGGGSTLSFRVEPPQSAYPASNVINGVTRPHRYTNLWRSDPDEPLPQAIELAWDSPRKVCEVQITFAGHLLREYHANPPYFKDPQCVRDYGIEIEVGDSWREIIRVEGNYMTRVVHSISEPHSSSRLRLVVYATNGDPSAAVYEIRCYERHICTPVG